jgi:2-oxoglutarate dehydrogenase E2 component (dihydrolipoamide succinyltransferase)
LREFYKIVYDFIEGVHMEIEIKIPHVGESIQEAVLVEWYKQEGDRVQKDEPLFVIETDKVTLEIVAEADGVLKVLVPAGATIAIGAVVGAIVAEAAAAEPALPPPSEVPVEAVPEAVPEEPAPVPAPTAPAMEETAPPQVRPILPPSVRRLVAEKGLDITAVTGTGPGNRITKGDVLLYLEQMQAAAVPQQPLPSVHRELVVSAPETSPAAVLTKGEEITRKSMSPMRRRIASRLLEARRNTAMLTTFNEIDMSRTMSIRARFKEDFKQKHGVSLGFMSFFIKASVEALKEFPEINAYIEGDEIVYHHYYNIGIAIGTARGLVVPVIPKAENLSAAQLEQAIVDYVEKIKTNRLELADMVDGTFTITNGGVFGSLLSTPILNTPQSGILGMHKIEKRPVVIDDQVQVRPMMYVALSYDHRIVDGREAVTFLIKIKEHIENPERIIMEI